MPLKRWLTGTETETSKNVKGNKLLKIKPKLLIYNNFYSTVNIQLSAIPDGKSRKIPNNHTAKIFIFVTVEITIQHLNSIFGAAPFFLWMVLYKRCTGLLEALSLHKANLNQSKFNNF